MIHHSRNVFRFSALLAAAGCGLTAPTACGEDLLVSSFTTNSVHRFDAQTGQSLGVFATGGGLQWPLGMAFGGDGNLYVSSWLNNKVLRFDGKTGAFIDVFIEAGVGGLERPEHLEFRNGMLYVQTAGQDLGVLRYDAATGAFIDQIVYPPDADPFFAYCEGMAIGDDGDIYVSARNLNQVMRFDGDTGAFVSIVAGFVYDPEGIAFGPDGNLYVAEYQGDEVSRHSTGGDWLGIFVGDFWLDGPMDVEFDEAGDLYVVNYLQDSVEVFDGQTGALLRAMQGVPDQPFAIAFMPGPGPSADLNGDGHVNGLDLALLLGAWGACRGPCPADLNGDGLVNGLDLAQLLGAWG
jgi:DNA-binding beta-propeller fold protein YncE